MKNFNGAVIGGLLVAVSARFSVGRTDGRSREQRSNKRIFTCAQFETVESVVLDGASQLLHYNNNYYDVFSCQGRHIGRKTTERLSSIHQSLLSALLPSNAKYLPLLVQNLFTLSPRTSSQCQHRATNVSRC
jgi:hypothetical protein